MLEQPTEPTKSVALAAPEKLTDQHDLTQFDCGEPTINDYLAKAVKQQAMKNAVVYVTCLANTNIVKGYYTLSNGTVLRTDAPSQLSRNSPLQVPVTLLGRMGIDQTIQGSGYGLDLLKDAIERAFVAAQTVGSKAMIVSPLTPALSQFYKKHAGFQDLADGSMTLFLKL